MIQEKIAAKALLELAEAARRNGDERMAASLDRVIVAASIHVPAGHGFPIPVGESMYERYHFCVSCRTLYPKEVKVCPSCHNRLRTRARS